MCSSVVVDEVASVGGCGRRLDAGFHTPFVRHHVNMLGRYSFRLPELPGASASA
ncbi:hypothetical protein ACFWWM_27110 [Streptomyces sp. NPDC058682]|uniref:hypothetical protein n=1 Tax=Streptomyces sp. NPDC058682 TaxID=3346596 RepID=UPI0036504320